MIRWSTYLLNMGIEIVDRCIACITIKSTFLAQQVVEILMWIIVFILLAATSKTLDGDGSCCVHCRPYFASSEPSLRAKSCDLIGQLQRPRTGSGSWKNKAESHVAVVRPFVRLCKISSAGQMLKLSLQQANSTFTVNRK